MEVMVRRCNNTRDKAFSSRALLRGVTEMHRLLGDPSEQITRDPMKRLGVKLSGKWMLYVTWSKAKVRRDSVPKSADTRSTSRSRAFLLRP